MRRLAPLFLTTSILAFAAAANAASSPTVPANTQNPAGMSYTDKSSTAKGTNAKMDSNSTSATATTSASTATTALANDDKSKLSRANESSVDHTAMGTSSTTTDATTDTTKAKHKAKKAKKKLAKNDHMSATPTNGAASKSTTGLSPGGDGSSSSGSSGSGAGAAGSSSGSSAGSSSGGSPK